MISTSLATKPVGVTKPVSRATVNRPAAKTTTSRPATRAYTKSIGATVKEEEPEEPKNRFQPLLDRAVSKPGVAARGLPVASKPIALPEPTAFERTAVKLPTVKPNVLTMPRPNPTALQSSAIPAPILPRSTEVELENLMKIGREQVETELKYRISVENVRKRIIQRNKQRFNEFKMKMATLHALENDLRDLKEENRIGQDELLELADGFRANTMKWAALFEQYANNLGITIVDLQRLGEAWQ